MKAIGQSANFINFSQANRIYVDKTREIFSLIQTDRIFFSRPRRFGKTLALDTIATLFEKGVEPYFKDTWIYDKWEGPTYPVLRLNFLEFSVTSYQEFCADFVRKIQKFAQRNNIDCALSNNPKITLENLFETLSIQEKQIVILIDEYDCQMTANINKPELYNTFLEGIRSIYAFLKGKSQIRFLGITGVTRLKRGSINSLFSKVEK